jgi:uncharacterized alpha-E superfamily protein
LNSLLSRFAENSFWLARYMQRAENLARILEVNETFARNARGEHEWMPILRLHQDVELFNRVYRLVDGARVVRFYTIDENNPNSIRNLVHESRENARSIRHLISLECWVQLNVFDNWVRSLTTRSVRRTELSRLCGRIKENCQLHFGIADATLYRDQIWSFYRLGRYIELCDQTTRLVDMKYHSLLPSASLVGTPLDVAQWNALLRSASAYHGYRRVFPHQMTPSTVAGFIVLNPRFPRSVTHCVQQIRATLTELLGNEELQGVEFAMTELEGLERLIDRTPEQLIAFGMHEFLDSVQLSLNRIGDQIGQTFFLAQYAAA